MFPNDVVLTILQLNISQGWLVVVTNKASFLVVKLEVVSEVQSEALEQIPRSEELGVDMDVGEFPLLDSQHLVKEVLAVD